MRFAMLYGSGARGDDTPTSDLDVIVELQDSGFDAVVDLASRLTSAVGRPVDLVRLEDAEADPRFLADILEDARVLVDRVDRWQQVNAQAIQRPDEEGERISRALAGIDRFLASDA